MSTRILTGDCRSILATLPDQSVHACVTSPPYYGLRDYGVSGQIGLERTLPEYVAELVAVFRDVRRVLRDDGTLWLNLGDSYATGAGKVGSSPGGGAQGERWAGNRGDRPGSPKHAANALGPMTQPNRLPQPGLKPKDLMGVPWRVAFALQDDGWYVRSDIIWHKPNPMPESITDRPTSAHEHVFLLSKSPRYYYDAEAIKEPCESGPSDVRKMTESLPRIGGKHKHLNDPLSKASATTEIGRKRSVGSPSGRNCRNVWRIGSEPYRGAHFAVMPTEIPRRAIKAGCPTGGTVLDPFGGAGTVGLVAEQLGRHAVLIELNPEYAEIARTRIYGAAPLFADIA